MKMLGRLLAVAAALFLFTSVVHAQRAPVPIVDHPNVPAVAGSGKPVSAEALARAIIDGGAAGARKWDFEDAGHGTLRGTYKVRSHTVMVHVVPGTGSYSLKYAHSINMKYQLENGTPVIHPFYNRWVDELLDAIRLQLKKL
jgi:hypothetical protein